MSDDNGNRSLSALPHDNGAVTAIGAVAALSVVAMLRRRGGSNIPGPYARSASLNKRRSREEKRRFVQSAWAKRATPLPRWQRSEYPPIPGMEGPFQFKDGRILYYDPREGRYYDRKSDMYLSREDTPGM